MKYKLRDKRKRNQLLKAYYKANPELTLSEIGETFGVSRQRVKQIIDNGVADKAEDNKAGS